MRPFTSTITLDEARARLLAAVTADRPRGDVARSPRRMAECWRSDIAAPFDVPPFDRSAMDGYAVRAADTPGASRAAAESPASSGRTRLHRRTVSRRRSAPGDCVEIATGAPMPASADAVVMVEDTAAPGSQRLAGAGLARIRRHACSCSPRRGPASTSFARRRHECAANCCSAAARCSTPSRVGALAAVGLDRVTVYARPLVAILPTGNEVVAAGPTAARSVGLRRQQLTRSLRWSTSTAARPCGSRRCATRMEDVRAALDADAEPAWRERRAGRVRRGHRRAAPAAARSASAT